MSKGFLLLLMVFCHIIDDYCLQSIGPLASLKQKSWWDEHYPQKIYKFDFVIALVIHSASWSFMVMLPVAYYLGWNPPVLFFVVFAANVAIHAVVDHIKANRLAISLTVDQLIHIAQIIATFLLLV